MIKEFIKRIQPLYNLYLIIRRKIIIIYVHFLPVSATKTLYKKAIGHSLNLEHPKAMTEKMQWLKLNRYYHNPDVTRCIDKYRVREFVSEKNCEEILIDLYGVWDKFEDIDFSLLPEKFVLKCNHGCGYNIICDNKEKLDIQDVKKKINTWMKESYGMSTGEIIYSDIERKIICEKYIETEDGDFPKDYKIFCSYGTPKFLYVVSGGHEDDMHLDYYTTEWKRLPVTNGNIPNADNPENKPKNLEKLLEYASLLSSDFPMVRVDLYSEKNQIFFGELTFLATGGMFHLNPQEYDYILGDMFNVQ